MTRTLIIEDNRANMKLATLLLSHAGHTVLSAVDAETGLAIARRERPDLILMDIQLPGMDGLAATTLLKQDPATAGIPIIALTAMAMKADEEKARTAGCDAYITKPLRYQELSQAIEALLAVSARGMEADPGTSAPSPGDETGPPSGSSAVDVSMLESLVGTDPVVVLEFLTEFRTSAKRIAQDLQAACARGMTLQAGEQAHKLKSSARAIGAYALGDLCAEMEAAGRARRTDTLTELLPLFEHEYGAVNAFLDQR